MQTKLKKLQDVLEKLQENADFLQSSENTLSRLISSLQQEGKILVCGNGGSATQASHMVGELIGRFAFDRPALPAVSLFDLASTTAIGNDYGYTDTFSRFVDGLGKKEDILFSLSTSGNSENCLKAIASAKEKGMTTISLLGKTGGKMKEVSDISIVVPSDDTPTIQEVHLMLLHHFCEKIEEHFFKNPSIL